MLVVAVIYWRSSRLAFHSGRNPAGTTWGFLAASAWTFVTVWVLVSANMPPLTFVPEAREDHRSVMARRKREAMRARILLAIMASYADRSRIPTSIEEVARAAEISRGTFYNHFTSLDEALIAVGREVTDRMTVDMLPFYEVITDPVNRVSTGLRLMLTRALTDQCWAAFVLRSELVGQESVLMKYLMKDLRSGMLAEAMEFDNLQAAADSVMGATVEGIRTILMRRTKDLDRYIDSVIRIALCGLAVDKRRVLKAAEASREVVAALPDSVRKIWRIGQPTRHSLSFSRGGSPHIINGKLIGGTEAVEQPLSAA